MECLMEREDSPHPLKSVILTSIPIIKTIGSAGDIIII